ncbi:MAG: HD domain-containing phosphohydrolase [Saccharofermentanales bacterium]
MTADLFNAIIENSPVGYAYQKIICNRDGIPVDYEILDTNISFENFTGLKSADVIGKKISDIVPGIYNDDYDWAYEFGDVALNGGSKVFEQYSVQLKRRYRIMVFSPRKYYFTSIFSEMAGLEHKLNTPRNKNKNLSKNMAEIVWTADLSFHINYISPNVQDNLGYSPREAMVLTPGQILTPGSIQMIIRFLKDTANIKRSKKIDFNREWTMGLELYNKEGDIILTENLIRFLSDRDQNPIGFIGLCRDISRIKTSDEIYGQRKDELSRILDFLAKGINGVKAENHMQQYKLLKWQSEHFYILSSIKATMFEKHQQTADHSERLVYLSKLVGKQLKLSQKELDDLSMLALLHDVGKLGIDDSILNKKSNLNKAEWKKVKRHPEIGYRIAMSIPELKPIVGYILCHQERWDGKGYPRGYSQKEIPLPSRIISIVDAYDAMTHDRSYRKAMSKDEAINEIRNNAGTQFDPYIARVFIEQMANA